MPHRKVLTTAAVLNYFFFLVALILVSTNACIRCRRVNCFTVFPSCANIRVFVLFHGATLVFERLAFDDFFDCCRRVSHAFFGIQYTVLHVSAPSRFSSMRNGLAFKLMISQAPDGVAEFCTLCYALYPQVDECGP